MPYVAVLKSLGKVRVTKSIRIARCAGNVTLLFVSIIVTAACIQVINNLDNAFSLSPIALEACYHNFKQAIFGRIECEGEQRRQFITPRKRLGLDSYRPFAIDYRTRIHNHRLD